MAVKVLISRKLKPGALADALKVLGELRVGAMGESGYITGETLRGHHDPQKLVVISTWESPQAWESWQMDPARQEAENRLKPFLAQPTQVEVFDFGGSA
jgi:quinol monooxygenase YgiN